jgi:RNA polymerase sigma factor for flagellar operon FliA
MHRAVRQYTASLDAESNVILENARLLDRCVHRLMARTGLWDFKDDLWVAGALALVDASRRFDATRGIPFAAFAERRVRGALLDELRRMDHLPRRLRADAESARRARDKLRLSLGREPEAAEVATALGMPVEQMEQLESISHPPSPLNEPGATASTDPTPMEAAAMGQSREALAEALGQLPDRLRTLVALHYLEGLTYREIAGMLEVSEPRVCQLHAQAITMLRKHMHASMAA